MAEKFYTILTQIGKAKIANASALGNKVNFTHFALGDGGGQYYNPAETQEVLRNEVWRGQVSSINTDANNSNWIVIETAIPATDGGFMIREAGIFDSEGNLVAIGKYPETYKPIASEGSAKDLYVRMILEVSNASVITLKIDPTVILATKKDINILSNEIKKNTDDILELKQSTDINGDRIEEAHNAIGNINDPTLPAELKGKALTEQTKYVLANAGKVKSVNGKTGTVVIDAKDLPSIKVGDVNIGHSCSTGGSGVVIGYQSHAVGQHNIAIGNDAQAINYEKAIAIGNLSRARKANAIAIGTNAHTDASDSISMGVNAKVVSGGGSVIIGPEANGTGDFAIALGYNTKTGDGYGVAIGANAENKGYYSVAIGRNAVNLNGGEGCLGEASWTKDWRVPGTFKVNGTKNFEMPHPKPEKKATHVIRHGTVESPTAGDTLYRYRVVAIKENDLVTIDLPDYFIWLNKDVQIFVTPQGHFGNSYGVLNREAEQLEIHCQYEGEYNVLVIGTRNDDHQSVQDWDLKGVERETGESWTGETYAFEVDEIIEVEEIKEVA
jgi:hypothetical protein